MRARLVLAAGTARIGDFIRDFGGNRLEVFTGIWFARNVVNDLLAASGFRLARLQLSPVPSALRLLWRRGGLPVAYTHRESCAYGWSDRRRVLDLIESVPVRNVAGGGSDRQMLLEKVLPRRTLFDSIDLYDLAAFEMDLGKGNDGRSGAHGGAAFDWVKGTPGQTKTLGPGANPETNDQHSPGEPGLSKQPMPVWTFMGPPPLATSSAVSGPRHLWPLPFRRGGGAFAPSLPARASRLAPFLHRPKRRQSSAKPLGKCPRMALTGP